MQLTNNALIKIIKSTATRLEINFARAKYSLRKKKFQSSQSSDLIVAFTSYPKRIDKIWLTVESLFRQNADIYKIICVLAEPEFPGRTIPPVLDDLVQRGLTIMWTSTNHKSYKKLIPPSQKYKNHKIVTVDDDVIYKSNTIKNLADRSLALPNAIIGHRGRVMSINDVQKNALKISPKKYSTWPLCRSPKNGNNIVLTGVGAILYPSGFIKALSKYDVEQAIKICPTADDIWFWAISVSNGFDIYCLGQSRQLETNRDTPSETLTALNVSGGQNDIQLENAISFFNIGAPDFWQPLRQETTQLDTVNKP